MPSINFIGGEKGGVGKSVVSRVLAQYFIDKDRAFTGFDTDRSHTSFARFYADFAAPVVVDTYEGLDHIAAVFEEEPKEGQVPNVIVDLAAQTATPMARWVKDSDLIALMAEMGVSVNLWHVADSGKDSMDMLGRLLATYGAGPRYIVVKNHGRGSDFSLLEGSEALARVTELGGQIISVPQLHEASMRKIDRQSASFSTALHQRDGEHALGMLERQRVKSWLKSCYTALDTLQLD